MNIQKRNKLNSFFIIICGSLLAAVLLIASLQVQAASSNTYTADFETDTSDWGGDGAVNRVASGTNGITSAGGQHHAVVSGDYVGPHTKFGGYSSVWPGDWNTSINIYLDPSWTAGQGLIYTVASNNKNGTHLRDFVFHAGVLNDESTGGTNKLIVLADHHGSATSDALEHIKNFPALRGEVSQAGWYTIKHQFKNIDGKLNPTVHLVDPSGNHVKSWNIQSVPEIGPIDDEVGGNRYGWFTHVTVSGGVAIDNVKRFIDNNLASISNDATQPFALNLSEGQTITLAETLNGSVTTPVDISIIGETNKVEIFIPEGTEITAENSNWDGTINAPEIITIDPAKIPGKTAHFAVKVGADTPLSFSNPVKLVLPGQAGKTPGFLDKSNVLHPINTECKNNPRDQISGDIKECYQTDGSNLIIWTNHFSTFIAYTQGNSTTTLAETGMNKNTLTLLTVVCLSVLTLSLLRTFPYKSK